MSDSPLKEILSLRPAAISIPSTAHFIILFVKLLDELFDLGDAALED